MSRNGGRHCKRKWRGKSLSHVWLFATPWSVVHGILQARIPEWVAFPFSSGSSQPRDQTRCTAGRFFTNWAIREDIMIELKKPFENFKMRQLRGLNSDCCGLNCLSQVEAPKVNTSYKGGLAFKEVIKVIWGHEGEALSHRMVSL